MTISNVERGKLLIAMGETLVLVGDENAAPVNTVILTRAEGKTRAVFLNGEDLGFLKAGEDIEMVPFERDEVNAGVPDTMPAPPNTPSEDLEPPKIHIGEVAVVPHGQANPYAAGSVIGPTRARALQAFRLGGPNACIEYDFWYAPGGGGANVRAGLLLATRKLLSPNEIDWESSGLVGT